MFDVSPYIGEWIEISEILISHLFCLVSPYIGEWIEIDLMPCILAPCQSLTLHRWVDWNASTRSKFSPIKVSPYIGEWIEIRFYPPFPAAAFGLTLHRWVDWNFCLVRKIVLELCLTLHRWVDWNCVTRLYIFIYLVSPYIGEWIEISTSWDSLELNTSHLT